MMPVPNLRRRLLWQVILTAIGASVAVVFSVFWAVADVEIPPAPAIITSDAMGTPKGDPLAPEKWLVDLWRPLVDAPVAVAAPPPPPTVRLFSILKRNGSRVAALDLGGSEGLTYVKAGESIGAVTVVAIDAAGADIAINGQRQRLELGQ